MATYTRSGVLGGQTITLRAIFTDDTGCLIDPDAVPAVYIYDPGVAAEDRQSDIDASTTFPNATAGPFVPTQLSTGYYEYVYTVPSGGTAGVWYDVWDADVDTVDVTSQLSFTVVSGTTVATQSLSNNTMVIIELDSSIGNVAADATLSTDQQLYFTTKYSPLYASPDLVRLEVGAWISYIPEDTLALMIHIASKEADFIQGPSACNTHRLRFARMKFVVFDTAVRVLSLMGHGITPSALSNSGGKKMLGDLSIQSGGNSSATEVNGEIIAWVAAQREEWFRVVNAGGCIVPGEGLGPTFAVKGVHDPDRRMTGRLWEDPSEYHYAQPTSNAKGQSVYYVDSSGRYRTRRRGRFGFRRSHSGRRWRGGK